MPVIYNKVALIGLGLIASSMFWGMKRAGLAGTVSGFARSAETRDTAREIGLCDEVCDSIAKTVEDADLVILCVPVGVMGSVAAEMAGFLKPGCTVTDVGSVKADVIAQVGPLLPEGVHFIPAHPLAGTEHSGPRSGFAELFDNRWCLLVPAPDSNANAVARLRHLWEGLGANVEEMDA
ncbi:MAG: cyclohexadieny/prephenate dehydrogenase [Sulfitobacter sp.]|jgi:cyclohexadieny/prephenate dehydrogenase